jgi:alginate O-acetyltransferase complex protein AlgI
VIAIIGVVICLLPALPFYERLKQATQDRSTLHVATNASLILLYVLSIARAMAAPFKPFIYFRF